MPKDELCSFCNVERLALMQKTPYSTYDEEFKSQLDYINKNCARGGDTSIPPAIYPKPDNNVCGFDNWFTVPATTTCDQLALDKKVSTASLFMANQVRLHTCGADDPIQAGTRLCLPTSCDSVYQLKRDNETCDSIEDDPNNRIVPGDVRKFNVWVGYDCRNLGSSRHVYGNTICLKPQGGEYNASVNPNPNTTPSGSDGYTLISRPAPENAPIAPNTTPHCGKWHVAAVDDACVNICVMNRITSSLFLEVNPSLGTDALQCSGKLKPGSAYCVGPTYDWKDPYSGIINGPQFRVSEYGNGKGWRFDQWSKYGPGFDGSSQTLSVQPSEGGKAVFSGNEQSDFVMEASVTLKQGTGNGNAGLIFRATKLGEGADNYYGYYVGLDANGYVVLGRASNNWAELANAKLDTPAYETHKVRIEAIGDRITVSVDDKPKIDVKDSTHKAGAYGVRTYSTGVSYNYLRIAPVWSDSFEGRLMRRWTVHGGSFTADAQFLFAQSSSGGKAVVDESFTDMTLEADVTVRGSGDSNAGLILRASDLGDGADSYRGYYVGISPAGYVVVGRANQGWTEIGRAPASVQAGKVYHLVVKAVGESISVFLGDLTRPLISLKDDAYREGKIGVRVYETNAEFDNIKVVPVSP